jgi:2-polyprenyl-3-methyl-5-hydroxy-6-metoxy-1,4-benzoquinol methylase
VTRDLRDRILSTCGGGRTLHVGNNASLDAVVSLFRQRAVEAVAATTFPLPFGDRTFDLVCAYGILDTLADDIRTAVFDELLRVSRGPVMLIASGRSREQWEADCLRSACRKHPLHQMLVPYDGLDWATGPIVMLFDRIDAAVSFGRSLADLAPARDLHMDMLREPGRRSDAHIARYMLARQFVRPGDRVLDAACGLGYGGAILADGTLAETVLGLDGDPWAIQYAQDHYARSRSRLTFDTRDLATLGAFSAGSFDIVVSFETLEHLADPDTFLADCRRLLTPAGRIICSVPNQWVDESGRDPNPHHLHVFDRATLEARCRKHFYVERVFGETAGGGMKLPAEGRAIWTADHDTRDAEWWLLVGMTSPSATATVPFRNGLMTDAPDSTNVLAFERDYDNPWLAKAMVTIGLRTESKALLDAFAHDTIETAAPFSADTGAALCVSLYRHLDRGSRPDDDLLRRIDAYCHECATVPHVRRWQISLRYAAGVLWLALGNTARATRALESCAHADALTFSPLLATKTVGAALLRGWLAAQARDVESARRWWQLGIDHAEHALHRPWNELLLNRESPALFGLREAALVVDLASRCAAGLHLLPHVLERPGIVCSQIFESPAERASDAESLRARAEAAEARVAQLTKQFGAQALVDDGKSSLAGIRVAVFGAGAGGQQAIASLRARGAIVDCVADNNASRHGSTANGVTIVDPSTLPSRQLDLIAVASLPGRAAILAQLAGLGFQLGRDVAVVSPQP